MNDMPRRCTVCDHEKLEAINQALLHNETLRKIAQRFSVTVAALFRHKKHLPAAMVQAREAQEITQADGLLEQVVALRDKALSILAKAERAGDLRTALQGVREAKGCLELLAKLQLALQEWAGQRAVLIRVRWETEEVPTESVLPLRQRIS